MYHLPNEIISYIYEYDNTYREIFDKVLKSRYEIYQNLNSENYFIFDLFSGKSFTTDSLDNPTWKTTHHTHKNRHQNSNLFMENFKTKMINKFKLKRVNDDLKYNIHECVFIRGKYSLFLH